MMKANDLNGKTAQMKDWRRRIVAFAAALTLLISSCGLTAFAEPDEDIYSAPVTAPIAPDNASPEPEEGTSEVTPAPKTGDEADTEPEEDTAEKTGTETEGEPEAEGEQEGLTVYEPGTLTAEAEGVEVMVDYTAEARVPEGSVLTLTRAAGGDLYSAMKSAAKVLKGEQDGTWAREIGDEAVFYTIRLTNPEGEEVHPETDLTLTCSNLEIPENAAGFVTGNKAENLDWTGTLSIDFLPDAIGYAYLRQVQIGTVTLTHEDSDYTVIAAYGPDAGFPAGTELNVREIRPGTPEYALYSGMTDEALSEDWSEITLERYFDITFTADGTELEPQGNVDVQIVFRDKIEQNEETEVQAVHIENNEASVIESETDSNEAARHDDEAIDTVSFTSDSFSVYGVVQKKKIITKILETGGNTYEIGITYTQDAEIPENAQVRVEEIPEGSDLYNAYKLQTAAALNADDVRLPGLYDISIVDEEGARVEPKVPVNVAVRLLNDDTTEDIQVVHFTEEMPRELVEAAAKPDEQAETSGQTEGQPEEQTGVHSKPEEPIQTIASETIEAKVEDNTVTFDTQSFSVYAFAYTVDFYYGEFEYHLTGGGAMTLSELFNLLDIKRSVADIASVTFSDPSLISVSKVEKNTTVGNVIDTLNIEICYSISMTDDEKEAFVSKTLSVNDWVLISMKPFTTEEKLLIKFRNGDTIEIKIEDAQDYKVHFVVNDNSKGYFGLSANGLANATNILRNSNNQVYEFDFTNGIGGGVPALSINSDLYALARWIRSDGVPVNTTGGNSVNYQNNQVSGSTTFIAFFKPKDQSIILYEAGEHGRIDNGDHHVTDHSGKNYYFSYSGDELYAHATADNNYILEGWYQGTTFLSADEWLNLSDVDSDMVITARFKPKDTYAINYRSNMHYTNVQLNGTTHYYGSGNWTQQPATEYVSDGGNALGATAAEHGTSSGATDWHGHFVAWVDENNKVVSTTAYFKPTGELIRNATYTALFANSENYVYVDSYYESGSVGGDGELLTGYPYGGTNAEGCNTEENIIYFEYKADGSIPGNLWPVPNEGYEFDHWEFNNQRIKEELTTTFNGHEHAILANSGILNNQGGTLRAVYKPCITYDIGVINRVGINAPDTQRWYSASWCPTPEVIDASVKNDNENIYYASVNYGQNWTVCGLSRETRVTQTTNGYNLLTHYFKGWKANKNVTTTAGTVITAGTLIPAGTELKSITEAITFTAVWSSTFPGKEEYNGGSSTGPRYNTNSVGFFIRIVDNVADIGDTSKYTECLYTTRLSVTGTGSFAGSANGTRHDFFGNGAVNKLIADENMTQEQNFEVIKEIDEDLRAGATSPDGLAYRGGRHTNHTQSANSIYTNTQMHIERFPDDDFIFSRLRLWNLTSSKKITVSGEVVPQWMLTKDYFEIRWYVLKDQENQWHIDGALIPKYAKMVIKKRFLGEQDAIKEVLNGNFSIAVDANNKSGDTSEYTLKVMNGSGRVYIQKDGTEATDESSSVGYYYCDTDGQYVWVLNKLLPLTRYYSWENNYVPGSGNYASGRSWVILNPAPGTTNTSGNSFQVIEGFKTSQYAEYVDEDSIQTLIYTNLYTIHYVMTILKQDGNTLHGLSNVAFDFTMKDSTGMVVHTDTYRSDANGQISIGFDHGLNGSYTFTLQEQKKNGYNAISTITGAVTIDSVGKVDVTDLHAEVTGDNALAAVDDTNKAIVYIKNTPERRKVIVEKIWTDGTTTTPVVVQLLRNGIILQGYSVELNTGNNFTYEWNDLPAYVDGRSVLYTVREEWIGEAGGVSSTHYSTANGSDGYAEYIVSQTQTTSVSGDITTDHVRIENTPDNGQVIFIKTDLNGKALEGAVFTLYEDSHNNSGPKNPLTVIRTYTSDPNGVVTIDELSNDWYWLKETTPPTGYVQDDHWYAVQIQSHDSVIYDCDQTSFIPIWNSKVISIKNTPTGNVSFKAMKVFTGGETLLGEEFTFTLTETDAAGNVLPTDTGISQTHTNNAAGEVIFDEIELTNTDTRYFMITENIGEDTSIIYDDHSQAVTVTVTNENGILTASKSYEPAKEANDTDYDAIFENIKKAELSIKKSVIGVAEGDTQADGDYTFRIKGKEGTDTAAYEKVVVIKITNGAMASATIDGAEAGEHFTPASGVTLTELMPGIYIVEETGWPALTSGRIMILDNVVNGNNETITLTDGKAEIEFAAGAKEEVIFSNRIIETVNIQASKQFVTGTSAEQMPKAIRLELFTYSENDPTKARMSVESKENRPNPVVIIRNDDNTWPIAAWNNLQKYLDSEDGHTEQIKYAVEETGVYFGELDGGNVPAEKWIADTTDPEYNGMKLSDIYGISYLSGDDLKDGNIVIDEENHKGIITITNEPKLTEVAVEKTWSPDFTDSKYTWEATFILKSDKSNDQAVEGFRIKADNIEAIPHNSITISNDSTQYEKIIVDLPRYELDENDVPQRITYTLEETEYTVRYDGNEVLKVENGKIVSGTESVYTPYYNTIIGADGSQTVTVSNSKPTNQLVVKKKWMDVLPEYLDTMPTVQFHLMWRFADEHDCANPANSHVYALSNGDTFTLSASNNWQWTCPESLPTTMPDPQNSNSERAVVWFVKEVLKSDTDPSYNGKPQVVIESGILTDYQKQHFIVNIDGYETSDGHFSGTWQEPYLAYLNGNTGTITIRNRCPGEYLQIDIKKKLFAYDEDGALWTVTSFADYMKGLVLKIQIYRRIVEDKPVQIDTSNYSVIGDPLTIIEEFAPYGHYMLVGYDPDGSPVGINTNVYELREKTSEGPWHWTIGNSQQNRGLPRYGLYTKNSGSVIPVRYEYLVVEEDAYKDHEMHALDEYSWYAINPALWDASGEGVACQIVKFKRVTAQDQDRLVNLQSADLKITKQWNVNPDGRKVYVKLYRTTNQSYDENNGTIKDVTNNGLHNSYDGWLEDHSKGYTCVVEDAVKHVTRIDNETYIVLHGNETVMIHNVERGNENGGYRYWIKEVGYEDSMGRHMNETDSLTTEYEVTDGKVVDGFVPNNLKGTISDAIILGQLGRNHFTISNTIDVVKAKPTVTKKLNGASFKGTDSTGTARTFEFELVQKSPEAAEGKAPYSQTVSTAANGTITFEDIEFTGEGTYVYEISEKIPETPDASMIYDTKKIYTQIVISKDESTGKLTASEPAYFTDPGCTIPTADAVFNNIEAGELELKKLIIPRTGSTLFEGIDQEKFTFRINLEMPTDITIATVPVSINNAPSIDTPVVDNALTVVLKKDETAKLTKLPVGTKYHIEETNAPGYTISWSADKNGTGTITRTISEEEITNTPAEIDLTVIKKDTGNTTLAGAKFTLTQVDENGTAITGGTLTVSDETTADGTIKFENLKPGYYQIAETKAPDGYSLTNETITIQVVVENNIVVAKRSGLTGELIMIEYDQETQTVTVHDTPVVELPSTGGSGTLIYTLTGIGLVLLAGVILVSRKKRKA